MFAKLVVLILGLGLIAAGLLAARQERLLAAHDLAEARLRIVQRDNELWRLRAAIAARVTPEAVEAMARELGPLKPMAVDIPPSQFVAPGFAPVGGPGSAPGPTGSPAAPARRPSSTPAASPTPAAPAGPGAPTEGAGRRGPRGSAQREISVGVACARQAEARRHVKHELGRALASPVAAAGGLL